MSFLEKVPTTFKPFKWVTDTGVPLEVKNEHDLVVFCDIFVNNEYPIFPKVNPARTAKILDLGANIGYFSLYAAHRCKKFGQPYTIFSVEGNPDNYDVLTERTKWDGNIRPYFGLIGKKKGSAYITASANHATCSVVPLKSKYPKIKVDYIDLNNIGQQSYDIIKCDIEGAEFDFIKNYPEILKGSWMVFMEVHYAFGDIDKFRKTMKDKYGYNGFRQLMNHGDTASTEVYYRE